MPEIKKSMDNVSVSTNTNSLFNQPKNEDEIQHCTQNVNVTVKIDQQENVLTGCIKAIASIFKKKC
jgi:hypothetical protein